MRSANGKSDGSGRRTRGPIRRALVALLVAGVAVVCGPGEGGGPAVSLPPTTSSASPSTTSAAPIPSLAPTTVTPSAVPTTAAPQPPTRSVTPADPKPAATTQAPRPTAKVPTQPTTAECEIVSNAGNCYKAGQFCRKADLGRSTHAANGRLIYCRMDGTQPRWQY
ncbi:hypothetical protein ACFCV9_34535 [Streptomyces sp. NPDC056367]|uniref:hypothetical protein n=1 Tax=Streptomyces sp. NPDC056367 TaxID=3345797 RepID=UPI0035D91499